MILNNFKISICNYKDLIHILSPLEDIEHLLKK